MNVEKPRSSPSATSSGQSDHGQTSSSTHVEARPTSTSAGVPWFTERFWSRDPSTAAARKTYNMIMIVFTALIILCVLSVLPIYWGALWQTSTHIHNVKGWVVDFDNGEVGTTISNGIVSTSGPPTTMSWELVPSTRFPNGMADVEHEILEENVWAIVAISAGATTILQAAITSANTSYAPNSTIAVVAAEARSENAFRNVVRPVVTMILDQVTASYNTHFVQQLAQSGQNLTALASTAPTLVTQPVSYTINNIRPFDVPVASAVDFVGLIYLLILAFNVTMVNYSARIEATNLELRLRFRSLLAMRILIPIFLYFFISLFYALLSLAFQVPFNRTFGHAGFVIYWMMSWFAMAALGLAVEAVITILTTKFVTFFLLLWVVANAAVCFLPPELLPGVYRYAYASPFYNVQQAVRTIVFNTKNQLGLNFGVQLAWIGVSLITITVLQYFKRYQAIREHERMQDIEKRA
ncbi:hypothetical protein BV25DRAFT_1821336 [Artomyces pyxidatus]|uniref:Uncharacterized protein n=1 Tax=Artomyces pyxidatus TaxID=48021 RepID=A0ACB8TC05_9AGAM|nr:hypothetical protein BV25DRAFT_1821336 [Artomyces pyxidatus]